MTGEDSARVHEIYEIGHATRNATFETFISSVFPENEATVKLHYKLVHLV